jgi:hypothetical protein
MTSEERIPQLCEELLRAHDPDAIRRAAAELRSAIHEHIQEVRRRALAPIIITAIYGKWQESALNYVDKAA